MNENQKTGLFVAVAVALVAVAWLGRPASFTETRPSDLKGQKLFADFDPLTANSMEIVEYDQSTATLRPFEVAQAKGRWSIPSHDNYPADAKDQVAQAAANLIELRVLEVVSDEPGDHVLYGVVEPEAKTLTAGSTGVGTRVTLKDAGGKTLVALIVGKQVPDKTGLRYVRRAGTDQVVTVELNTDKFSTKFQDWIEKDLLKMSSWDIKQVQIRDYSVDEVNGTVLFRDDVELGYNDTGDPKWKLVKDQVFDRTKWVPQPLAEDEELNTSKLDDMKFAVSDLKIVDVQPKPKGLSDNLAAEKDFTNNREAIQSLGERGFHVAQLGKRIELLSNQGEIRTLMKDGVEYTLRFGEVAVDSDNGPAPKDDAAGKEEGKKDAKHGGLNRYIFVTTQFNPEALAKPQLDPLPEVPDQEKDADKDKKADDKKAEEQKDGDKKAEAAKPDPKAERERIEKENKRKQDEYDQKVKDGQKKVKELSARFSDWYYVISDETYGKIHLGRKDFIKKKEKKEEEKKDAAKADEHAGHDHAAAETPAAPAEPKDQPAAEMPVAPKAEPEKTEPAKEAAPAKPAADKPAAEKPAAEKPAAEKPADKPADKPAAEKPADKPAATGVKESKPAAAPAKEPAAQADKPSKPGAEATKPGPEKKKKDKPAEEKKP